jgi:hypothetical protein
MSAAKLRRLQEFGAGAGSGGRDSGGGAPSDLDLMLYFDGELDDERAKEVEVFLRTSSDARQKLAALDLGATLVRDKISEHEAAAPDLSDAVMARVALETQASEASPAPADSARSADQPSSTRRPLRGHVPVVGIPRTIKPAANDNARRIFALAAMAIAAAAALMFWARTETTTTPNAGLSPTAPPVAVTAPSERPTGAAPDQNEPPTPDQEVDVGVEVASVDFGTQTGAIFYVPGDTSVAQHSTTVVWLADELTGGE